MKARRSTLHDTFCIVGERKVVVRQWRSSIIRMMRRQHNLLLTIALSCVVNTSHAFVRPSSTLITMGRSVVRRRRQQQQRQAEGAATSQPRDLLPSVDDLRLEKAYALSGTLRWERRWDVLRWDRRSTLTSDEEMAPTSSFEDDESSSSSSGGGGPPTNVPEFPEMMSNGIYEIINADQHK